jgi:hypothetical protein
MSAKHLARLRAQQGLQSVVGGDSNGTESDEEDEQPQQLAFNPFDLIQDDEESADEAVDDAAAPSPGPPSQPAAVAQQRQRQQAATKVSGKPHDKHKAGKAAAGGRVSSAKGARAAQNGAGDDADLDQLLKEMDMAPGQVRTSFMT